MSIDVYFSSGDKVIEDLFNVGGDEAFHRALKLVPKSGYLGDFLFGFVDGEKRTTLDFAFRKMIYPALEDMIMVNFVDESERELNQGAGWVIRNGEGDFRFEVEEDLYAYERNFVGEKTAVAALDYFLKTGDRAPQIDWEPFKFFMPGWEDFFMDNGSG